jgi:hypothetical protein
MLLEFLRIESNCKHAVGQAPVMIEDPNDQQKVHLLDPTFSHLLCFSLILLFITFINKN